MLRGGMTTIYVSDMDRAVDFYHQKLGLKLIYRAGNEWCGIDAGDGMKLGLHPASPKAPPPGANGASIVGLTVTQSLDAVVDALKQKGVPFKGPIFDDAKGSVRLAYFSDPDGNELYLCEFKWGGTSP